MKKSKSNHVAESEADEEEPYHDSVSNLTPQPNIPFTHTEPAIPSVPEEDLRFSPDVPSSYESAEEEEEDIHISPDSPSLHQSAEEEDSGSEEDDSGPEEDDSGLSDPEPIWAYGPNGFEMVSSRPGHDFETGSEAQDSSSPRSPQSPSERSPSNSPPPPPPHINLEDLPLEEELVEEHAEEVLIQQNIYQWSPRSPPHEDSDSSPDVASERDESHSSPSPSDENPSQPPRALLNTLNEEVSHRWSQRSPPRESRENTAELVSQFISANGSDRDPSMDSDIQGGLFPHAWSPSPPPADSARNLSEPELEHVPLNEPVDATAVIDDSSNVATGAQFLQSRKRSPSLELVQVNKRQKTNSPTELSPKQSTRPSQSHSPSTKSASRRISQEIAFNPDLSPLQPTFSLPHEEVQQSSVSLELNAANFEQPTSSADLPQTTQSLASKQQKSSYVDEQAVVSPTPITAIVRQPEELITSHATHSQAALVTSDAETESSTPPHPSPQRKRRRSLTPIDWDVKDPWAAAEKAAKDIGLGPDSSDEEQSWRTRRHLSSFTPVVNHVFKINKHEKNARGAISIDTSSIRINNTVNADNAIKVLRFYEDLENGESVDPTELIQQLQQAVAKRNPRTIASSGQRPSGSKRVPATPTADRAPVIREVQSAAPAPRNRTTMTQTTPSISQGLSRSTIGASRTAKSSRSRPIPASVEPSKAVSFATQNGLSKSVSGTTETRKSSNLGAPQGKSISFGDTVVVIPPKGEPLILPPPPNVSISALHCMNLVLKSHGRTEQFPVPVPSLDANPSPYRKLTSGHRTPRRPANTISSQSMNKSQGHAAPFGRPEFGHSLGQSAYGNKSISPVKRPGTLTEPIDASSIHARVLLNESSTPAAASTIPTTSSKLAFNPNRVPTTGLKNLPVSTDAQPKPKPRYRHKRHHGQDAHHRGYFRMGPEVYALDTDDEYDTEWEGEDGILIEEDGTTKPIESSSNQTSKKPCGCRPVSAGYGVSYSSEDEEEENIPVKKPLKSILKTSKATVSFQAPAQTPLKPQMEEKKAPLTATPANKRPYSANLENTSSPAKKRRTFVPEGSFARYGRSDQEEEEEDQEQINPDAQSMLGFRHQVNILSVTDADIRPEIVEKVQKLSEKDLLTSTHDSELRAVLSNQWNGYGGATKNIPRG